MKRIFMLFLALVMLAFPLRLTASAARYGQSGGAGKHQSQGPKLRCQEPGELCPNDHVCQNGCDLYPQCVSRRESGDRTPQLRCLEGGEVVCDNLLLLKDGYYMVTEKTAQTAEPLPSGGDRPDQEKTAQFAHRIFDGDGSELATFSATVTGTCSGQGEGACLTGISGGFTDCPGRELSYGTSIDGDTGTVQITMDGEELGTFTYTISEDGRITW